MSKGYRWTRVTQDGRPMPNAKTGLMLPPSLPKSIKAKERLRQREAVEKRKRKWWYRLYLLFKGGKK